MKERSKEQVATLPPPSFWFLDPEDGSSMFYEMLITTYQTTWCQKSELSSVSQKMQISYNKIFLSNK
jgi:hypothetical protein